MATRMAAWRCPRISQAHGSGTSALQVWGLAVVRRRGQASIVYLWPHSDSPAPMNGSSYHHVHQPGDLSGVSALYSEQ